MPRPAVRPVWYTRRGPALANEGLTGGRKGESLVVAPAAAPDGGKETPIVRVGDGHTGEEVLVAAQGPGAERVRGFFPNTRLFEVLMAAYGWTAP